ncbi:MAG: helix-turn-helix domain-containing protein [Flavobacteriales bacterium]|jgi:transcriptional regulator with XRE-family HTH domain|uniref:helix-turn-helix domain-containing protein n=1 Tax=Candidatus Ulvibacter alkanivorans TaxID=2267620 RepID=UPI000DF3D155|nr:helix-turn-helix transcriptional regulator [Candidatus Ulvibacter alkanivorans]MCH2488964.1 helix-turn-helix domain-containing protein [Flavobacteriales bacterium]
MVNSADFAKRLEKILEYYSISATAFSEQIDFNRSTISHILSGRNKPSLEFVMKVVQEFPEVELYWLLNGKGTFPAQQETSLEISRSETTVPAPKKNTTIASEIPQSLPKSPSEEKKDISAATNKIERIVIFYTDGSFKAYEK